MNMIKPLVLVAEDNCLIARAAQLSLKRFDVLVDIVCNGLEAIAANRSHSYSLILMDVEMPLMDGVAATKAIRLDELQSGAHITIIGVTSIENPQSVISCGMDDCVSKPADYEALLRTWLKAK